MGGGKEGRADKNSAGRVSRKTRLATQSHPCAAWAGRDFAWCRFYTGRPSWYSSAIGLWIFIHSSLAATPSAGHYILARLGVAGSRRRNLFESRLTFSPGTMVHSLSSGSKVTSRGLRLGPKDLNQQPPQVPPPGLLLSLLLADCALTGCACLCACVCCSAVFGQGHLLYKYLNLQTSSGISDLVPEPQVLKEFSLVKSRCTDKPWVLLLECHH